MVSFMFQMEAVLKFFVRGCAMGRFLPGFRALPLVSSVVLASFGIEVCASAYPGMAGTHVEREASVKRVMELALALATTPQEIAFMGVLGGANPEPMQAIREDLAKKTKGATWPKFALKKNEVFADGKATGIQISSYSPVNVTFKGKLWAYDKELSPEKNYFSLVKLFSSAQSVSLLSYLIPTAFGEDEEYITGLNDSPFITPIAAVVIAVIFGLEFSVFSIAGMFGFGVGNISFLSYKNRRWVADVLCSKRLQIDQCDKEGVLLKIHSSNPNDLREIGVENIITTTTTVGKNNRDTKRTIERRFKVVNSSGRQAASPAESRFFKPALGRNREDKSPHGRRFAATVSWICFL
jgi:hypothetical protein